MSGNLFVWPYFEHYFQVKSAGTPPGPRHSHSAVMHEDNVVISGGLDERLRPVNTIHILNITTWMWTEVVIPDLLPRYLAANQ